MYDVSESDVKSNSKKEAFFQAAFLGNTNLIHYLLGKGLNIDWQDDEEGDTVLHHAARQGHLPLVTYLLERRASVLIKNKKGRTALLEAYTNNQSRIVRKITKYVIEKNSIRSLKQPVCFLKRTDPNLKIRFNFIAECKDQVRKNYLNRNIFSRFMARHNGRAMALIQAFDRCSSIKEAKELIKNQCELFERGRSTVKIPSDILASRWSMKLKNKPYRLSGSSFYRMLKTMSRERVVLLGNVQQLHSMSKPFSRSPNFSVVAQKSLF